MLLYQRLVDSVQAEVDRRISVGDMLPDPVLFMILYLGTVICLVDSILNNKPVLTGFNWT